MRPFLQLSSMAFTMMEDDVDTDVIFPARFLLLMEKKGLGEILFNDRLVASLHDPRRRGSAILIAGANFGSGSSREHAVWALDDFGIRAVIAPSFGEIFYANCFNGGILPITLPRDCVDDLASRADGGAKFAIDLTACTIAAGSDAAIPFEVDGGRRDALLRGWDAIDRIFHEELANIDRFEIGHAARQPWLFG